MAERNQDAKAIENIVATDLTIITDRAETAKEEITAATLKAETLAAATEAAHLSLQVINTWRESTILKEAA